MAYWLAKSEPGTWSWSDMVRDGITSWDGVRNHQAKLFLMQMKKGDRVFFYHSGEERRIVGLMEVTKPAYADPTAGKDEPWVSVEVKVVSALQSPVTLAEIKASPVMCEVMLVKNSRLSVMPVEERVAAEILKQGGKKA